MVEITPGQMLAINITGEAFSGAVMTRILPASLSG